MPTQLSLDDLRTALDLYRDQHHSLASCTLATQVAQRLDPGIQLSARQQVHLIRQVIEWLIAQLRPLDSPSFTARHWRQYNVLYYFYQQGWSWKELASQMFVEESGLTYHRNQTLQATLDILTQALAATSTDTDWLQILLIKTIYQSISETEQTVLKICAVFQHGVPRAQLQQLVEVAHADLQQAVFNLLAQGLLELIKDTLHFRLPSLRRFASIQVDSEQLSVWLCAAAITTYMQGDYLAAIGYYQQANTPAAWQQAWVIFSQHAPALFAAGEAAALQPLALAFPMVHFTNNSEASRQLWLGRLAQTLGQIAQALEHYRLALNSTNPSISAWAYYLRGKGLQNQNIIETFEHYERALEQLTLLDSKTPTEQHLQAQILIDRAWLFLQGQPNLSRAAQDLQQAEDLVDRSDLLVWINYQNGRGELAFRQNNMETACEFHTAAWHTALLLQSNERLAATAYNVARDYQMLNDPKRALFYLGETERFARLSNDQNMQAISELGMGECLFNLGDYSAAQQHYTQALHALEQLSNHHWMALAHYDLAEVLAITNQNQLALYHFQQARHFANLIHNQRINTDLNALQKTYLCLQDHFGELTPEQQKALSHLLDNNQLTRKEYCSLTGVSAATATRHLNELVQRGILAVSGKGSTTRYQTAPLIQE